MESSCVRWQVLGNCKTEVFAPVPQEASVVLPEDIVRDRCEPLSDQNDFSESSRLQDLFVGAAGLSERQLLADDRT